ncbi:MAG: hypothetical protein AAFP19_24180, partial [Bacteroidota bacterium]
MANPTSTGLAPYTYSWTGPNGFSSNAENPILVNVNANDAGTYTVIVTDANNCQSPVRSVVLNVDDTPIQPTISGPSELCEGEDLVLTTSMYSGASLSYEWQFSNGGAFSTIAGATTNSLTINTTTILANEGDYRVLVTVDGCTSNPSANWALDILSSPSIPSPSVNSTNLCQGDTLILMANTSAASYQWTGPIGSGFSSTLQNPIISNVSSIHNGSYSLVIVDADGCESVAGPTANVSVSTAPEQATIATNGPICDTDSIRLSTSTVCASYQWIGPDGVSATTLGTLGDPNNPLWTTSNQTAIGPEDSRYKAGMWAVICLDASGCQSPISNSEEMIMFSTPDSIVANQTGPVCEGGAVQLLAPTVDGAIYYWYDGDPSAGGSLISNLQNPVLNGLTAAASPHEYYLAIGVNTCISDTVSTSIEIYERPIANIAPIDSIPCTDGFAELDLVPTVTSGLAPYLFSWTGPNSFASADSVPTLININSTMSGTYTLQVTDANGCTADPVSVEVEIEDDIDQPNITSSGPACEGGLVTLAVAEYSGTSVSYTWTGPAGPIANNSNELILDPLATLDAGNYTVLVEVDGCSSTSPAYALTVFDAPMVSIAPVDSLPCTDGFQEVDLEPSITGGTYPFTYTWSGPNSFSSTDSVPTLVNVTSTQSGTYTITITDLNGCTATASTELQIEDGLSAPFIFSTGPKCEGSFVRLSIPLYDGASVSYSWTGPSGPITNNSNELILDPVSISDAGNYSVTVIVDGCSATSNTYALSVYDAPSVSITPVDSLPCTNGFQEIDLEPTITSGTYPFTYAWSGPNSFSSTDSVPTLVNVTSLQSGTYTISVTDLNGCTAVASTELQIENGVSAPFIFSSGPRCEGGSVRLSIPLYDGASVSYTWTGPSGPITNNSNELILDPVSTSDAGNY